MKRKKLALRSLRSVKYFLFLALNGKKFNHAVVRVRAITLRILGRELRKYTELLLL